MEDPHRVLVTQFPSTLVKAPFNTRNLVPVHSFHFEALAIAKHLGKLRNSLVEVNRLLILTTRTFVVLVGWVIFFL
eukprot:SAG11_NODE_651_length_7926_cov_2.465057_2_plen_76_part_00